jgi:DNA-binding protein H-NS
MDLDALLAQRATLDAQITAAQRMHKAQGVVTIREMMAKLGVTVADLSTAKIPQKTSGTKVPAKYRDAVGNTWSGRGRKPRWLEAQLAAGVPLEHFLIRE